MKILKLLKQIQIIISSRFKKTEESENVLRKRKICKPCEYNSKNAKKIKLKKRILIGLSDFYSKITGKSKLDNLGNCIACDSCSIYFKSLDENHCPHPEQDKWK
jgi:hypothetical protein